MANTPIASEAIGGAMCPLTGPSYFYNLFGRGSNMGQGDRAV